MKDKNVRKLAAVAVAVASAASNAWALDVAGFEFTGYSRGGPVFNKSDGVKGNLALGGELQKFRLGNEGDYGIEAELARSFEAGGLTWKVDYMLAKWNNGDVSTEQAYVEMGGLSFAPQAKFWAGQRRLRIQDVHIVDNFLMGYGDYQGAGVTAIPLGGGAKLGLGVFSGDKFDQQLPQGVRAVRLNADISEIPTNPGGKLRVLLTAVDGSGLANGNSGSGVSLLHKQSEFLAKGVNNSLFLQASRGHARIDGQFEGIDGTSPGKRVTRIADSVDWQSGPFGGQALLGYQSSKNELTGQRVKDFSAGGRVSYAFGRNFKLLAEAGHTSRKGAGPEQTLNKFTVAPTLALAEDFWSRPELRFYVTRANWNQAAAQANAAGFGIGGKTSRTLAGVQYEVWW